MPAPELMWRTETAVLWAPSGAFGETGERKVVAGVEISVRWEDRKGEVVSPERGEPVAYDAWVALGQRVAVGSIFYRGTLAQWAAQAGSSPSGLYEAVDYREARDVRGRNVRMEARLARYRQPLPEVVS